MLLLRDEASLTREVMQYFPQSKRTHKEIVFQLLSVLLSVVHSRFTKEEEEKFRQVLLFTAEKHRGAWRTGEDCPYILHLLRVTIILLHAETTKFDLIVAAVLHDVYEDTDVKLREIEDRFGKHVAQIVFLVSKVKSGGEAEALFAPCGGEWLALPFFERLRACPIILVREWAMILKIADRIDNLTTLPGLGTKRMRNKIEESEREIPLLFDALDAIAKKEPEGSRLHSIIKKLKRGYTNALALAKVALRKEP